MPADARINAELSSEVLERVAAGTITNDVEAGRRFHARHRVEEVVEPLLLVQTTDE